MNIAVVMGGASSESIISLKTGAAVVDALESLGLGKVQSVQLDAENKFELPRSIDFCFNALHGEFGENGEIQKLLDKAKIPYSGSGAQASRLAFNKGLSKKAFEGANLRTPKSIIWNLNKDLPWDPTDAPLVCKPVAGGSSLGVVEISSSDAADQARKDYLQAGLAEVLCESKIFGREFTVGIIGNQVLPILEMQNDDCIFSYQDKYFNQDRRLHCPADLTPGVENQIRSAALSAHECLGMEVYSRTDVILDSAREVFVLETNSLPGLTSTSFFPAQAKAAGISLRELILRIVALSFCKKK